MDKYRVSYKKKPGFRGIAEGLVGQGFGPHNAVFEGKIQLLFLVKNFLGEKCQCDPDYDRGEFGQVKPVTVRRFKKNGGRYMEKNSNEQRIGRV